MRPLYIVPHTHWDREWYQPHELFRWRLVRMIDEVIETLEANPEFPCFNLDGQCIVVEDYLALRPERRERLSSLIRAGRIVIGPWWVQPDEFLPSGESHVRSLLRGIRYARRLGASSRIGHCADQFGHIAQLPQIMAQLGLRAACLWRGVPDSVPGWSFWWVAPDGSRLPVLYLRHSYSNGWRLPLEPDALLARIREAEEGRAADEPLLLMNGTDHSRMERHLPQLLPLLRAANYHARIATLDEYAEAMFAYSIDETTLQGELRSPDRSNVLPGVLSSRMNLKQRDFTVQSWLERRAEPLELLAWVYGGPDGGPALAHAWSIALENTPHDPICGCSVDQTHREMLPRYDRAEQLAGEVSRESLAFLAGTLSIPEPGGILVFRPVPFAPVPFEAEVPGTWQGNAVVAADLGVLPASFGPSASDTVLFDGEVSVRAALSHLDFLRDGRYDDRYLEEISVALDGDVLVVTTIVGHGHCEVHDERIRAEARRLVCSASPSRAHLRVLERGSRTIRAVLPPSPAIAVELLAPHRHSFGVSPMSADGHELRSERFTVRLEGRGITIGDAKSGIVLRETAIFLDEGERGDEYNADILDDALITPASVEFVSSWSDDVAAEMQYRVAMSLPRRLAPDRSRRTWESTVPLTAEVRVRLWRSVPWVEFALDVENLAEDHRLRLAFPLPFEVPTVWTENQFHVAERPVEAPAWNGRSAERPVATFPQKSFAAMERDGRGIAVFNRGLPEGEVIRLPDGRQAYAVTLLRCVGWLSRPDLRSRRGGAGPTIPTHDSQMLGHHRFAVAVAPYTGTWRSAGILPLAHAFAHPPLVLWVGPSSGEHFGRLPLVEFDTPTVVPSAVSRSEVDGCPILRLWSTAASPHEARLRLPWAASAARTNLLEEDPTPVPLEGGSALLRLRPWEIATLRLEPASGTRGRK